VHADLADAQQHGLPWEEIYNEVKKKCVFLLQRDPIMKGQVDLSDESVKKYLSNLRNFL